MKAVLLRTTSVPVQSPVRSSSLTSLKVSISRQDSSSGVFSGERHTVSSPRVSLNFEMNNKRISGIRRALSQTDVARSDVSAKMRGGGTRFASSRMPEEDVNGIGNDRVDYSGNWPNNGGDKRKMGDHYRELVKSNPTDSLILRNYGKFLHEVEKDTVRAEEYYGRAILANPGDGEVLCLYGNLIWMTQRDWDRAKAYFDQAVHVSPNDSTVLASYARFMWESEAEEEDEEEKGINNKAQMSAPLVAAF
ncbi:hypothetical protein Pint_03458 [Pistacia integerrima]|uniref:Uncharacterized protein n=1 Tax=Pistacia integerrima TaxID=434235 RepID=A0ACC0ZNP6_9ROSI|nr:hypothetical protein Pint_03458 [Pistacia integerrima]